MPLSRRDALIRRIKLLPDQVLPRIEEFVAGLEREQSLVSSPPEVTTHGPPGVSDNATKTFDWPHAPLHRVSEHGTYIVTAGTLYKRHLFRGSERLDLLQCQLLAAARAFNWSLEAWAVFSNHYHFVASSQSDSASLDILIKHLHAETAVKLNDLDGKRGRQVWSNYRDTELTFEKSYLARLGYVHHNAVRHGLVRVANQYPWCSAGWFERTATPAQVKTVYGFKIDKVKVFDDYEPVL